MLKAVEYLLPGKALYQTYSERDLDKYLNQEIEFVVTEFDPRRRRIMETESS